jgi:hypothetical protein
MQLSVISEKQINDVCKVTKKAFEKYMSPTEVNVFNLVTPFHKVRNRYCIMRRKCIRMIHQQNFISDFDEIW